MMNDEQCLLLKQRYPIGRKFWAKVGSVKPFGILVEIDDYAQDNSKCTGLIDIVHIGPYKERSQPLPSDPTQWPQKGTYINCLVCYYRESESIEEQGKSIQLGLTWLGEISQSLPDR